MKADKGTKFSPAAKLKEKNLELFRSFALRAYSLVLMDAHDQQHTHFLSDTTKIWFNDVMKYF